MGASRVDRLAAERRAGQTFVEARCADDECRHGRLAFDRTPACGCWPQEVVRGAPDSVSRPAAPRNGQGVKQLVLV